MPDLIVKEYGPVQVKTIGSIIFMENEMKFWAWSPYEKCSYRCVYCSVEAQGNSRAHITREEIPALLDSFQLHAKRKFPFYIGVTSDPYPPIEKDLELTRFVLSELVKRPKIRVVLCTHGDMIARDIDIYKQMSNIEGIGISITIHDDALIKKLEPGAPGFKARIEAAWALHRAGLPVHVNITPWIPGVSNVTAISEALPADMKVNVGVLCFNEHQRYYTKHLFGREISSAELVFGDQFSQEEMNRAFLDEYHRVGKGPRGNLKWLYLPNSGENCSHHYPDIDYPGADSAVVSHD